LYFARGALAMVVECVFFSDFNRHIWGSMLGLGAFWGGPTHVGIEEDSLNLP
jgi:hypothetical protein